MLLMNANNIYRTEHNHLQAVQLIGPPLKINTITFDLYMLQLTN